MNRELIFRAWHKNLKTYLGESDLTQLYLNPYGELIWHSNKGLDNVGNIHQNKELLEVKGE